VNNFTELFTDLWRIFSMFFDDITHLSTYSHPLLLLLRKKIEEVVIKRGKTRVVKEKG